MNLILGCVLAALPFPAIAAGELVLTFAPDMAAPPIAFAATADGGFLAPVAGRIEKFRADGARASDFHNALDTNSNALTTFIVPDGRGNWFVVGGAMLNGQWFHLVKLRANGSIASEFKPVAAIKVPQAITGPQVMTASISAIYPDGLGGCYIGGTFVDLNLVDAPGLAHIDDSGNVTAISRPAYLSIEPPKYLAAVPRGVLVVQGKDAFILTGNGSVIPLEQPAIGSWRSISSATYDPRFGIALSVTYFQVDSSMNQWIFVWDASGRLDPTFKQVVTFRQPFLPTMRWDSAGRLLGINARVGIESGGVTDDGSLWGVKRILRDGSLDPTWSRTLHFNLAQSAFCELANGDVLVSGVFTKVAGHDRRNVVRLTGANDSAFRFVQQSTRGWVDGNRKHMILGLVIPDRGRTVDVLIRAMSGSLKKYGVTDTVETTEFSVYRGQTLVTTVKANDPRALMAIWVGSRSGAFPHEGGTEAKALVSLEPGAYTVVISAPFGDAGEVLGEIYFPN